MGRFDHLTLQWFILVYAIQQSARNTFLPVPRCLMFLIRHWFVTQFNVVKVIYISKVAGVEVRPEYNIYYTLWFDHSAGLVLLKFGVETPGRHLFGTVKHTQCGADRPHTYIHSVHFWNVDTYRQKFEFSYDYFQLLIGFGGILLQIASK